MLDDITVRTIAAILGGLFTPVALYLAKRLLDVLNIREIKDSEHTVRTYLDMAIFIGEVRAEQNETKIEDEASIWLMSHVPKAVRKAELNHDDIRDLIQGKLKKQRTKENEKC